MIKTFVVCLQEAIFVLLYCYRDLSLVQQRFVSQRNFDGAAKPAFLFLRITRSFKARFDIWYRI